jgi:broad specificity phosphatase PhoE
MAWVSRLLVVRHAQSVWNAAGRWQGWADAPLSQLGLEQAEQAGRVLRASGVRPAMIACSDLVRAQRTAQVIAGEVGYAKPLTVARDLREQDLGEWNGLTSAEIEARWPSALGRRRSGDLDEVPGGETGHDFIERCTAALRRLGAAGPEEAVVVAHGGVIMALERALGAPRDGHRHSNLAGWWAESRGTPPELQLVLLARVDLLGPDLLSLSPRAVTGSA